MRPREGFTLIELVVALAITGVVVTGALAAVRLAGDSLRRARTAHVDALAAAAARATLEGWLRAATLHGDSAIFAGFSRTSGGLPRDELTFTIRDGGTLDPGPHRVRLRIDRDPTTPGQGLLAELTPVGNGAAEGAETLELAPGAGGLEIRYYARVEDRPQWLFAWDSADELPIAVEIRLLPPPRDVMRTAARPLLSPAWRIPLLVPVGGRVE